MGFAFAEENKDKVNEIAVAKDANGECIAPTPETIADGSYPLSRDLFIYVNKAKAAENPAVIAYVDYYLADGHDRSKVLETVPYVDLTADALAESTPPGTRPSSWPLLLLSERAGATGRPARSCHPRGPTRPLHRSRDPRWPRQVQPSRPGCRCRAARAAASRNDRPRPVPRRVAGHDPDQPVHHRGRPVEAIGFLSQIDLGQLFGIGWFPRRGIFDVTDHRDRDR